jgi:hypothetical protein
LPLSLPAGCLGGVFGFDPLGGFLEEDEEKGVFNGMMFFAV